MDRENIVSPSFITPGRLRTHSGAVQAKPVPPAPPVRGRGNVTGCSSDLIGGVKKKESYICRNNEHISSPKASSQPLHDKTVEGDGARPLAFPRSTQG